VLPVVVVHCGHFHFSRAQAASRARRYSSFISKQQQRRRRRRQQRQRAHAASSYSGSFPKNGIQKVDQVHDVIKLSKNVTILQKRISHTTATLKVIISHKSPLTNRRGVCLSQGGCLLPAALPQPLLPLPLLPLLPLLLLLLLA